MASELNIDELAILFRAELVAETPSDLVLRLPRRRHADSTETAFAQEIALRAFPKESSLAALIAYEQAIPPLRAKYITARELEQHERQESRSPSLRDAVRSQGPYDPRKHGFATPPAEPMPVQIASAEELAPFLNYLGDDKAFQEQYVNGQGTLDTDGKASTEPGHDVDMREFPRGVVYRDARMDLCKMVVGPQHISNLMTSLLSNTQIRHFLLGNNIIGMSGAVAIAAYLRARPEQMETWYLAGNMLDARALQLLAEALPVAAHEVVGSAMRHLWLKRNPLGPAAVPAICQILDRTDLITLDLDQTGLTDAGARDLFEYLRNRCDEQKHDASTNAGTRAMALRTIYLSGNGIGERAGASITKYLSHPNCTLQNLYISHNPLGDRGAAKLAEGISSNRSLYRFAASSCGINAVGGAKLARAFMMHPKVLSLDLGQGFATKDLGTRYNYIGGKDALWAIHELIVKNETLRCLTLSVTGFRPDEIQILGRAVADSRLHFFSAKSCFQRDDVMRLATGRLAENVAKDCNGMTYEEFLSRGLRDLRSPPDVRVIDSVYRNRDAGLARRRLMNLKKYWDDDDDLRDRVREMGDLALADYETDATYAVEGDEMSSRSTR